MESKTFTPIIVDLGSKSKKSIENLKKGEGKLMEEIEFTYNSVKSQLDPSDKEIIPLVMLYKEKEKSSKSSLPFPFPEFFKF